MHTFEDLYKNLVDAMNALLIQGFAEEDIIAWCADIAKDYNDDTECREKLYELNIMELTYNYIKERYPEEAKYLVKELPKIANRTRELVDGRAQDIERLAANLQAKR
jgi:hypothetical protein